MPNDNLEPYATCHFCAATADEAEAHATWVPYMVLNQTETANPVCPRCLDGLEHFQDLEDKDLIITGPLWKRLGHLTRGQAKALEKLFSA